jgi:hypothetical protein
MCTARPLAGHAGGGPSFARLTIGASLYSPTTAQMTAKSGKRYRAGRRPLLSGFGAGEPFAGSTKNSEIGTDSVLARRSRTSTVGFSSLRSRPPT